MRVVEVLPFVPTTWIESKAALGRAEHGHHAAHPVKTEAHAEQLKRAQMTLGVLRAPGLAHSNLQLGAQTLQALTLALDHAQPAPSPRSPVVRKLALHALDLREQLLPGRTSRRRWAAPEGRAPLPRAPRSCHREPGSTLPPHRRLGRFGELQARHTPQQRRGRLIAVSAFRRAGITSPARAPTESRQPRTIVDRLDRPLQHDLGLAGRSAIFDGQG